jgi:hypothetical protein
MVVFQGFASDLQDGVVPEDAYHWASDRDGELGQGSTLWALSLSPGEHTITLTVTDKGGLKAQASVHIVVLRRAAQDSGSPPLLLISLVILGMCGLAVVIVTGIWWLVLRRRAGM